ncbi:MAG: 4-alpha-glucanotransferase [Acidobacteria bacterium]|nr:4-alpha-glucanotransferase [Acidobacteriota bacterium]
MKCPRSSGILLHPTSLPGRFGIGDLGPEAYRFADFLYAAKQQIWQVLPLGPTGYGDSPYQVFSAFAGNPLLMSLELLAEEGLLSSEDWSEGPTFPEAEVDYGAVIQFKFPVLRAAFERFQTKASPATREAFQSFCHQHRGWLDDYAQFMAIKGAHGEVAWNQWDSSIALRQPEALKHWRKKLAREIECRKFWQFLFFKQWMALKQYCHARSIHIMGDIPIFVARDSADVWAHPQLFHLDTQGNPTVVAGVPPDYFSATGQLWGNPLYRWDVMAASGYGWWVERFRAAFELFDMVRIDHFRGFEAYWEVPAHEITAIHGRWASGPGAELFESVRRVLGELPIVAENLGLITPEVEALRQKLGFPGMAVLQFAFGSGTSDCEFLPHNYSRNLLVYTGTHDNDTTVGWWNSAGAGDSTRRPEEVQREREFVLKYLGVDGSEIHWAFIRAVLASVAHLAIVPLQDVLGLGSHARMNLPARANGNWQWRFASGMLTEIMQERLKELTVVFGRAPERKEG